MARIVLDGIGKHYDDAVIVRDLSLTIGDGELVVLVGPSGCGKSTILRLIAGLLSPSSGRIEIDGRDVTTIPPGERDIAMVFQSYALYPHMTVAANIGFPLRVRRLPAAEIAVRVTEVAETLGLGALLERLPRDLSGGQRQRVAMGRAIVRSPKAFLFDEPLSNLDAALRSRMRGEIAALHRRLGATMIYVTHDQHEAMTLADRLVLLNQGEIAQQGAPLDVYRRPASRFVGGFLGNPPMSFLRGKCGADAIDCYGYALPIPPGIGELPAEICVGVRPEQIRIAGAVGPALTATVEWLERTGSDGFLYVGVADQQLIVRCTDLSEFDEVAALQPGSHVRLRFEVTALFDRETGRALN